MTREQRLELLKQIEKDIYVPSIESTFLDDAKSCAIHSAIEELEHEPCEDCISRQAAIDCLNADFTIDGKENMETVVDYINGAFKQIKALPSVTPQQKVGKWIMKHRTYNKVKHYTGQDEMGETHTISVLERYEVNEPYCSKCGKLAGDTSQDFCCACGAKMEVEE